MSIVINRADQFSSLSLSGNILHLTFDLTLERIDRARNLGRGLNKIVRIQFIEQALQHPYQMRRILRLNRVIHTIPNPFRPSLRALLGQSAGFLGSNLDICNSSAAFEWLHCPKDRTKRDFVTCVQAIQACGAIP